MCIFVFLVIIAEPGWEIVYFVCVFVFVHSFLQILAGKLEVGVEDQVGDEAVDHRRR